MSETVFSETFGLPKFTVAETFNTIYAIRIIVLGAVGVCRLHVILHVMFFSTFLKSHEKLSDCPSNNFPSRPKKLVLITDSSFAV